ncbi:hypothetical protein [Sphingobium agri]|uniref:Uncharacterized protein n=1 Tax=Sphingobium agri TaxID=2933566 RepID=A0ABT0DWK6_9SPHN|nr:hypothetical protein [Sphingobium agri]MCK0531468.1 hypothetical protein [Sphingobium agri]
MSEMLLCEAGCGASYRPFPRRKTKLCIQCSRSANGRHPDKIAKSRDAMLRRMADPTIKAETLRRAHDGFRKRMADDPQMRAEMVERCRTLGKSMLGHKHMPAAGPARRKAVESRRRTLFSWCPAEYFEQYRHLVYAKRVRAADARAIVEQQIKADEANMSAFDKQLHRLRRGEATIVQKFTPKVDTGPFTLGGVASGMI